MTTVNWVVDTDGRFEVSSPAHLVQIMHSGEKYTDAGDAPANYLVAATSYIQTVDIDLKNYHSDIVPIGGGDSGRFEATYDGGGHEISNWELHEGSHRRIYSAMIGRMSGGGTVKHLRLTGVWKNTGKGNTKAFLVGYLESNNDVINDVKTSFEEGTVLSGSFQEVAGVIAGMNRGHISGCVVEGFIKISGHVHAAGGICGSLDHQGSITYCSNYGNFLGGIGLNNPNHSSVIGGLTGQRNSRSNDTKSIQLHV